MLSKLPEYLEDAYPLSGLQKGMLFHGISENGSGVYIEQICIDIDDVDFDSAIFKQSWTVLVARHAVLRTSFSWKKLKAPLQLVHKSVSLDWNELDWSRLSESDQKNRLKIYKNKDRQEGFLLERPPVLRMSLIRFSDARVLWIWTRHHIIADGWSTSRLFSELQEIYSGLKNNSLPKIAPAPLYRDYIAWLKQQDPVASEKFWRKYLAGFTSRVALNLRSPCSQSDQTIGASLASQTVLSLTEESTLRISSLCRESRVTLNVAVQAAWCLLLARYSDSDDIVWGCTFAGRPATLKRVDELVGLCINTLPVRQRINPAQPVNAFLQELQSNQLSVMEYETTALSDIQKWSDIEDNSALFDTLVVFENYPETQIDETSQDLKIRKIEYCEQSSLPLALIALPGKQLEFICIFDDGLYSRDQCDRMLLQLECLLLSMIADPEKGVGMLQFLPAEELKLLQSFAGAMHVGGSPPLDINGVVEEETSSIDQLVVEQALKNPTHVALTCGAMRLSYGELNQQSANYAAIITQELNTLVSKKHEATGKTRVVALHMERGIEAIVFMIATLRAGATYLSLDPTYSADRLGAMLEDSQAIIVISDVECTELFEHCQSALYSIQDIKNLTARTGLCLPSRKSSDLAYLLYTSGSTGKPKGVKVTHANLIASTRARSDFYTNDPSSFLLLSSLSFDSSVAGIYWTLTTGGCLVVSEARKEQDMLGLARLIFEEGISHTLCLPGLYQLLLEATGSGDRQPLLSSLKTVIVAGEALFAPGIVDKHRELLPNARLVNEYGPTEATVWCCAYDATDLEVEKTVPIGKPIKNCRLYVLDRNRRLSPAGVQGELAIAGDNVSSGYWNDRQTTSAKFIKWALTSDANERVYLTGDQVRWFDDGNLEYLGRNDLQVKIRGHRVELAEIEAKLQLDPDVKSAAVVLYQPQSVDRVTKTQRLVGCLIPASVNSDISCVMQRTAEILPGYMMPSHFEAMGSFPLLENGKLDRKRLYQIIDLRLQSQSGDQSEIRLPESEKEKVLWKIWSGVLGQNNFGIEDHFFQIGGDSIASIRVVSQAESHGYLLNPYDLFEAPTIQECARRMQKQESEQRLSAPCLSVEQRRMMENEFGEEAIYQTGLSDTQSGFLFAYVNSELADPGHMQIQARFTGVLDQEKFLGALTLVVKKHEALRTALFWQDRYSPKQVVFAEYSPHCDFIEASREGFTDDVRSAIARDKNNKLDLESAQVWRMCVVSDPDNQHILCWSCHHILIDGWSAAIVLRDLVSVYNKFDPPGYTECVSVQFKDYLHWIKGFDFQKSEKDWKQLASIHKVNRLKGKSLPNFRKNEFSRVSVTLKSGEYSRLNASLRDTGTTVSQLVHACWGMVLSSASKNQDFGFFSTVSGRSVSLVGVSEIVGQLVNQVPVFLDVTGPKSLAKYIEKIGKLYPLLARSQHVSPAQIQTWCGPNIHTVLNNSENFELPSLVMIENFPWNEDAADKNSELNLMSFQRRGENELFCEGPASSSFPLTLVAVQEKDALLLQLHFQTSLFEPSTVDVVLRNIAKVISTWSRDSVGQTEAGFSTAVLQLVQEKNWRDSQDQQNISNSPRAPYTGVEFSLIKIWQKLFCKKINNVKQDFFELGGTSMMAVKMAELVRVELGLQMSLTDLLQHNTVEKLAIRLSGQVSESFEALVKIQGRGEGPPVFGIHAEGNVLFYRALARSLGNSQPFYGLQTPELGNDRKMFQSIPEMAAQYIALIKTVQPEGPYTIVGMCFGGWVAFEMAQQLVANGDTMQSLFIFDSEGPSLRRKRETKKVSSLSSAPNLNPENVGLREPKIEKIRIWWKSKTKYSRDASLWVKVLNHYQTGRLKELTYKYIVSTPILYSGTKWTRELKKHETTQELIERIKLNQQYLKRRYVAKAYPGSIVFVRSEQYEKRTDKRHHIQKWQSVCDGEVVDFLIPGRHLNILEAPQVHQVAEIILSRISGSGRPSGQVK